MTKYRAIGPISHSARRARPLFHVRPSRQDQRNRWLWSRAQASPRPRVVLVETQPVSATALQQHWSRPSPLVPRETSNTVPVQPRRPHSGVHSLREPGHTTPGRREPLLRTKSSSEWRRPTFHVKRHSISSFRRQARSAEAIWAQNTASSIGSTPAASKLTGVTSTTPAVPAHFDTPARRISAMRRTSPSVGGNARSSSRGLRRDRAARRQSLHESGAPSTHARATGRPSSPSSAGSSPSTSASTDPPVDMNRRRSGASRPAGT